MAAIDTATSSTELALAFQPPGREEIPGSTILTRLNYYDGKFLRADDLRLEQDYLRRLVELDARAGGSGLVYGYDVSLGSGEQLAIGGGLAFDASGRALYMPAAFTVGLQDLIDATRRAMQTLQSASTGSSTFAICAPEDKPGQPSAPSGAEFFLITIAHAEEACGEEDVFGKLCDDGCATSTDRAYIVEGVVVRATPFQPKTPFITVSAVRLGEQHVRSQLVSAYYADEKGFVPCQISKAGLASGVWCNGAAAPSGWEVPIAVVGRLSSSMFVDEWVVRRERMETPPRRYWQGRMCMRPWDAFLAQVLQFQCQLPSVLAGRGGAATAVDPCAAHVDVIRQVSSYVRDLAQVVDQPAPQITTAVMLVKQPDAPAAAGAPAGSDSAPAAPAKPVQLDQSLHLDLLKNLQLKLADVLANADLPSQHILLDGGLVELPSAGYLPVTPGTTPPVDEQVRRLMGDGVDLRFCVTTPDYIPHALEKAQHMDRISLVQGLDDPANKPKVDVLVPDGVIGGTVATPSAGWDTTVTLEDQFVAMFSPANVDAVPFFQNAVVLRGAGRSAALDGGAVEFECAVMEEGADPGKAVGKTDFAGYASINFDRNPLKLGADEAFALDVDAGIYEDIFAAFGQSVTAQGSFKIVKSGQDGGPVTARGELKWTAGTATDFGTRPVIFTLTPVTADKQYELVFGLPSGTQMKAKLLEATVAASADVFTENTPIRVLAENALAKLTNGLDNPAAIDAVRKKLFDPNAGSVATTGGVTATLDWVLFHRRRHKDCSVPQAPPPTPTPTPTPTPVETEKHLVQFVDVSFLKRVQALLAKSDLARVLSTSSQPIFSLKVGDAEFTKGQPKLVTPSADLLHEWGAFSQEAPIEALVVAAPPTALVKKQTLVIAKTCGGAAPLAKEYTIAPPPGYSAVTFLAGKQTPV